MLRVHGAQLLLIDRDQVGLQDLLKACGKSTAITAAVSSLESPQAFADALVASTGPLFGLVHLAGLYEPDEPNPGSRSIWGRALAVNLTSEFDLAAACLSLE